MTVLSKGKGATLFGLVLGAIGAFVSQPDVQSTIDPKWAPVLQLVGMLITAIGPSLIRSTNSETRSTDTKQYDS